MKLACGNCWDRDCNCTSEQLRDYEERCKNRVHTPTIYSTTEPKVSQGDIIIIEDDLELIVTEIKDGYPIACSTNRELSDGSFAMFKQGKVDVPYKKLELSNNWKTLDGRTYRSVIEDEVPDSITHTRSMSVEDIIKEYGDTMSEEALETIKGIQANNEKRTNEELKIDENKINKVFSDAFSNMSPSIDTERYVRIELEDGSDFPFIPRRSKLISEVSSATDKVVHQPCGSYTPTKDGFFIPPDRKPYNPDCVEFSGRIEEYSSPLLEEVIALAEKEENKTVYQDKDRDSFVKCGMALDLFMSGHKGFIAGGCFKNIFLGQKIKDVDIFFENMEDWSQAFNYYSKNADFKFVYHNANACCFRYIKTGQKVEIIKSRFGKPEDLIREFDFTVAKFAYYKDTSNDITEYRFVYHPDFFEHLVMKKLVMDESCTFPVNTFERTYRYQKYGFSMCRETKQKLIKLLQGANVDDIGSSLYFGFD